MSELKLELIEGEDRTWLDFIVDGESLYDVISPGSSPESALSCLTLLYDDEELQKALDSLLLRGPADFPDNRRALYVCSMCGDLACGANTVVIEEGENTIIWRDFGWENTYEDDVGISEEIGPFVFDKAQYIGALKDSIALLK